MAKFAVRPHVRFSRDGDRVRCSAPFSDVTTEGGTEEEAWERFSVEFMRSLASSVENRDRVDRFRQEVESNSDGPA